MRLEKGSKRCALVVTVNFEAFFTLFGASERVPGDEAAMFTIVIVSGSNSAALWLAAYYQDAEFANRPKFWKFLGRWPQILCQDFALGKL
jgi:hypothetical protein